MFPGTTAADYSDCEAVGHMLRALDIVLVNTRTSGHHDSNAYVSVGYDIDYKATMYA
jgi:hypothetical protein